MLPINLDIPNSLLSILFSCCHPRPEAFSPHFAQHPRRPYCIVCLPLPGLLRLLRLSIYSLATLFILNPPLPRPLPSTCASFWLFLLSPRSASAAATSTCPGHASVIKAFAYSFTLGPKDLGLCEPTVAVTHNLRPPTHISSSTGTSHIHHVSPSDPELPPPPPPS